MTNKPLALQIGDKYRVTTPANWKKGDDVIVHPSVSNDEAKTLFPEFTQHLVSDNYLKADSNLTLMCSPTSAPLHSTSLKGIITCSYGRCLYHYDKIKEIANTPLLFCQYRLKRGPYPI